MGDRANIVIDMPTGFTPDAPMGSIYLYTHWSGYGVTANTPNRTPTQCALGR